MGASIPASKEDTYVWLDKYKETAIALDSRVSNGDAEGVVIRTMNRDIIVKLRFEDYESTFRRTDKESYERLVLEE